MKILSLLLCLSFLLTACLFDESNLDASQNYLLAQGVELSNDTISVVVENVVPDSLTVHRSERNLFDATTAIVGSNPLIGHFTAGFGYDLTTINTNVTIETLETQFYPEPYWIFDIDSLYSRLAGEHEAVLFGGQDMELHYTVLLYKYSNSMREDREDSVAFFGETGHQTYDDSLGHFFHGLNNPKNVTPDEAQIVQVHLVHTLSMTDVDTAASLLDSNLLKLFANPMIIPLGKELRDQVIAMKDSLIDLSIVFTGVNSFGDALDSITGRPADSLQGTMHIQVDYPKPVLCFSDSLLITHSIDRFSLDRIDTLNEYSVLGTGVGLSKTGLDSISFTLNSDSLLNSLEATLGEISGQYVDHVVQRATLRFTLNDNGWSEFNQPFVIEAVTETFDMNEVEYNGFKVLERQFAEGAIKNIVDSLGTEVAVDITETIRHILNLGRVGAEPVTYLYPAKSVRDIYKKYLYWNDDPGTTTTVDDNRFNRLFKSIDFSNLTFDLHIELIKLGSI